MAKEMDVASSSCRSRNNEPAGSIGRGYDSRSILYVVMSVADWMFRRRCSIRCVLLYRFTAKYFA